MRDCGVVNKSLPLDYIPTSLLKSFTDTSSILISHLANLSFTHVSIQIQTGTYLTPAEKTWFTEIWFRKLQTNIQYGYHASTNPRAPCPLTFFSHIKKSPGFLLYSLLITLSIVWRLIWLNTQTIYWKPSTLEKLQFSLTWMCPHLSAYVWSIAGYVFSRIRSQLTDLSSFVKIDYSSSPSTTKLIGVPQGSVIGPYLFVLSISQIANVINSHQSLRESMLLNNGLHLNPSKSE